MRFSEYFIFASMNFMHSRKRSWLTMLGIFIGIASVVSLISIGQGFQNSVNREFQAFGTDKILVTPGGSFMGALGGAAQLTDTDLQVVKRISGVKLAGEAIFKIGKLESGSETGYTYIIGVPLDETIEMIRTAQNVKIDSGRYLQQGDTFKVVIGSLLAKGKNSIFDSPVALQQRIQIEGEDFRVIGIAIAKGNPQDDSSIFIPIEQAREIFREPTKINMIIAQVMPGADPASVAGRIKQELRQSRNQKKGEEDFAIQTSEDLIATYNSILSVAQIFLLGIAAISILVGGVGVMNTMYTAVLERTNDIGVMKAIGAKNRDIGMMFLIESGMLGLIGGAIGAALGFALGKAVEFIATQALGGPILEVRFSPLLIGGALVFSFVIGALSGLLPAYNASQQKPVDALRYE